MSGTNYYDVLGIDANASPEDIRRAYRKKALRTHPDRLPQGATTEEREAANESFGKVNNAYEILIDSNKRKMYDLYGVWPPPEELPEDARQQRSSRSTYPSHRPYPPPGPHFDPFFSNPAFPDPFSRHRHPGEFAFTNPFELFDSMFADMMRDFHAPFPSDPSPFFNPSAQRRNPMFNRSHAMSNLSGYSPFFLTPSLFPDVFDDDLHDNWDTGASRPGGAQNYSFQSSSRAQYGTDPNNQQPRWVSESTMMRTINGVTQTIHKKKDSLGNEHVTKTYPDGRQKYLVNGIEQPQSSGYIQDSSRAMRQQSTNYDSTPPIIPPDTSNQEGTSKKRWWGRR